MALDKYYGSAEDLKRFVNSCHEEGIAVLLDVVFNHAFSQSPLAQLYWDANNNRPAANNPWLNTTPTHPFNVGYDFNHESEATQEFVQRVLTYWLEEFHIDGFRFDLSKGFTQRVSFDDNSFRAYDQKRVAVLKQYGAAIQSIRPDAYLILEHFADTQEENELAAAGFLLWSGFGLHHQYLEAAMGYPADLQQVDYRFAGFSTPSQLTYIESHDEERLVYKNKQFGNQGPAYSVKNHPTALERAALASLFFFPIPGPKMMWQFQELGYDYPINYCPDGSINENCRTAPKPITWNYLQDPNRLRLFQTISALNHLKKEYAVFQEGTMNFLFPKESIKIIHLQKEAHRIAIMGNFGTIEGYTKQTFPTVGTWYEFFSGDSLQVTNQTMELKLEPGGYKLYSNQPIGNLLETTMTTSRSDRSIPNKDLQLKVQPNPVQGDLIHLSFELEEKSPAYLMVFDALGRVVQQNNLGILSSGKHHQEIAIPDNGLGWLYVTLQTSHRSQTIPVFSP
jgi:1,4-alpha-glucan branching enzyme